MTFRPVDINTLLKHFIIGIKNYDNVYNYPVKKIYKGHPKLDTSVYFHNKKASTPVGPASGPHTQLAQNIVTSWLAGSRIIELKTIQINDELDISKPCIDASDICFNVEFSQELNLDQSLREYVKAHMIIEILKKEGIINFYPNSTDTIFELSIGYNLEGITKNKIRNYINNLKDAFLIIEEQKSLLKGELEKYKEFDFETNIINSITLSTFHNCPVSEIQEIVEFLITEMKVSTTVKMNSIMLGKEKLKHILHNQLGYHHIHINPNAYKQDIGFDNAVNIVNSLYEKAQQNGVSLGIKFCNTLEVLNKRNVFKERVMYMSGEPLHLIALYLINDFRKNLNKSDVVFSLSGGVSEHNFCDVAALGLIPITVCTDLLRPKGYARINNYLRALVDKMLNVGSQNIAEYTKDRYHSPTPENTNQTIKYNTEKYVEKLNKEYSFYTYDNTYHPPKKKDVRLDYFDCTTCGLCIEVCPNRANFFYPTEKKDMEFHNYVLTKPLYDYKLLKGRKFSFNIKKTLQVANYFESCNECGNCETFCPENGAPFKNKPLIFSSMETFEKNKSLNDAFYIEKTAENNQHKLTIYGRINKKDYSLTIDKKQKEITYISKNQFVITFNLDHTHKKSELAKRNNGSYNVDMGVYYKLYTILTGIMNDKLLNNINIKYL